MVISEREHTHTLRDSANESATVRNYGGHRIKEIGTSSSTRSPIGRGQMLSACGSTRGIGHNERRSTHKRRGDLARKRNRKFVASLGKDLDTCVLQHTEGTRRTRIVLERAACCLNHFRIEGGHCFDLRVVSCERVERRVR
jgi:hypothetical protein